MFWFLIWKTDELELQLSGTVFASAVVSCGQLSLRLCARGTELEALQHGPDAARGPPKGKGHGLNNDVRAGEIIIKRNAWVIQPTTHTLQHNDFHVTREASVGATSPSMVPDSGDDNPIAGVPVRPDELTETNVGVIQNDGPLLYKDEGLRVSSDAGCIGDDVLCAVLGHGCFFDARCGDKSKLPVDVAARHRWSQIGRKQHFGN